MSSLKVIELKEKINAIVSSPIFNFSLSSKELFHSNFLAWLINENKDEFFEILVKYTNLEFDVKSLEIGEVHREKNHFDLTLEVRSRVTNEWVFDIIIENKVKSLPDEKQLKEYNEKALKQNANNHLILLTLSEPSFVLGKWKLLTYKQLLEELKNKKLAFNNDSTYKTAVLNDYLGLVEFLCELDYYIIKASEDESTHYNWYDDLFNALNQYNVRMGDFYMKKNAELLALKIYNKIVNIPNIDPDKIEQPNSIVHGKDAEVRIYYKVNEKLTLSIELSGMYYRRMIHITESKTNELETIRKINSITNWLDLSGINLVKDNTYLNHKEDFLKFGDTTRYRQIKISTSNSYSKIIESFIDDVNTIIKLENEIPNTLI